MSFLFANGLYRGISAAKGESMFRIDRVQLITIPTTDQVRSLGFYRSLGFEVRADFPWADAHRWRRASAVPAGND